MRVVLTSCGLEPWESSSTDPYPLMPGCCPKICQNRCHLKQVLIWKSRLNWSIWKDCPERDNGPLTSICDKQVWGSGNSIPASPRACCKEGERKQPTQEHFTAGLTDQVFTMRLSAHTTEIWAYLSGHIASQRQICALLFISIFSDDASARNKRTECRSTWDLPITSISMPNPKVIFPDSPDLSLDSELI